MAWCEHRLNNAAILETVKLKEYGCDRGQPVTHGLQDGHFCAFRINLQHVKTRHTDPRRDIISELACMQKLNIN